MKASELFGRLILGRKGMAYLLIITLCYLAIADASIRDKFVTIATMVVAFYFGAKVAEKHASK